MKPIRRVLLVEFRVMKKNMMINDTQILNPAIVELVRLGDGMRNLRLSGNSYEETKQNFRSALNAAKERLKQDATT